MYSFFPGSFMLSQAIMRILYTGGSPGEVLAAVEELTPLDGDDRIKAWPEVWRRRADRCAADGAQAARVGHSLTGRESFLRACSYYQWAASFGCDHETTVELHRRSRTTFGHFAELCDPVIEAVQVPYEDGDLPAWFVPGAANGRPGPVAV